MLPFGGPEEAEVVVAETSEHGETVVSIRAVDILVLRIDLEAFEVIARDEVDDAARGVRAVDDSRTVLQDLDARKRRERNVRRVGAHAPAVEQGQRLVRADSADVVVDRPDQRGSAEVVSFARRRTGDRQALGEFKRGGSAAVFQFLDGENLDRKRRILGRALDERTGDNHTILAVGRLFCGRLRRLVDGVGTLGPRGCDARQTDQNRSARSAAEHVVHDHVLPIRSLAGSLSSE